MRKHNCQIGFNDKWLMILGIPILSFLIPIVFMGCRFDRTPYFTLEKFGATFLISTVLWIGNRYIMIFSRRKYPSFNEVKKRIIFQSTLMIIFTIIFTIILGLLLDSAYDKDAALTFTDKIINGNSASLFCVIMIIGIYESIYFMHQLRHSVEEQENLKRENLKAQLDALKTQVNPHFLFNNLNTLSSLIPENPDHAVSFVHQLSKVYRYILEVKDAKLISLKDELAVIEAYSFLLKTRFENNLNITIQIPPEKLNKKIIPLSLQLLIENAIKHNIVSSEKPLHILIESVNGSIVVENNLQIKNQLFESTGIGLENIKNRYKLITDKLVTITSTNHNFVVSIPVIEN